MDLFTAGTGSVPAGGGGDFTKKSVPLDSSDMWNVGSLLGLCVGLPMPGDPPLQRRHLGQAPN